MKTTSVHPFTQSINHLLCASTHKQSDIGREREKGKRKLVNYFAFFFIFILSTHTYTGQTSIKMYIFNFFSISNETKQKRRNY